MAVTEKAVQESFQGYFQGLDSYASADVTINDYSVLEDPRDGGPFIVIENSDDFDSLQENYSPENQYNINLLLLVPFTTDASAMNNFRDYRQEIIDGFNGDNAWRSPAGGRTTGGPRRARSGCAGRYAAARACCGSP